MPGITGHEFLRQAREVSNAGHDVRICRHRGPHRGSQ
jgi:hypothetical protein